MWRSWRSGGWWGRVAGVVGEADGVALAELVALGPVSSTGHRIGDEERAGWPRRGGVGGVEVEGAGPPERVRGRLRMNRGLGSGGKW